MIRPPSARGSLRVPALLLVVAALGAGCTAGQYAHQADRSAWRVLEERSEETLGDRRETVKWPEEREEEPEPAPDAEDIGETVEEYGPDDPEVEPPARLLSLEEALATAVTTNREYVRRKEDLYLTALGLAETRHAFSPLVDATLNYFFSDGEGLAETHTTGFSAGVSQILPTGATVSVDGSTDLSNVSASGSADTSTYDSQITFSVLQPLLRGAGYEASHEALTSAERNMIYAVRDFELFREDFSIDVASRFYDLVQQYQSIENERLNLDDLTYAERQAKALYDVGRTRELDVLRARRNRLNAENRLIAALESYEEATERFRIFLGLPDVERIDIIKGAPEFVPVNYDVDSAVEVALANRLDLQNERERLEDSERQVRLAQNGLLPDLDLDTTLNIPSGPSSRFAGQQFNGENVSVNLSLEIPIDRVNERAEYRRTQIRLAQDRRSFEEFRDSLIVTVESAFRELERRKLSLEIQRQLIEDEQKNVRVARLRFERGEIPNRDVVEAQQSLLDARNSLIREQVNYEIARLQLLRDLGIVFIDEQGMWTE